MQAAGEAMVVVEVVVVVEDAAGVEEEAKAVETSKAIMDSETQIAGTAVSQDTRVITVRVMNKGEDITAVKLTRIMPCLQLPDQALTLRR